MGLLSWFTRSRKAAQEAPRPILEPPARPTPPYVKPEYCANGCGREASKCESGGQRYRQCGDIEDHQPRMPGAEPRFEGRRGGAGGGPLFGKDY